jgi:hypothetical protein
MTMPRGYEAAQRDYDNQIGPHYEAREIDANAAISELDAYSVAILDWCATFEEAGNGKIAVELERAAEAIDQALRSIAITYRGAA